MTTSSQRNWAVFVGAIAATVVISYAYLSAAGVDDGTVRATLRWSARAAYLALLLAFVARPLQQLFKTPFTTWLLRHRRLIGVAFAGIHTAHLGLIYYRAHTNEEFVVSPTANHFGVLVYVVILVMFATSFDATTKLLGRRNWKILHKVGLFGLFVAFVDAVLPKTLDYRAEAVPYFLTALALTALLLRAVNAILINRSKAQPGEP